VADRADVLVQLYSEERLQARQAEDQRATLTNIIIIAVAAGLGLVADQEFGAAWLPVASAMVLLGTFGAVATRKCFERWFRHWTRAYAYREQLFDLYPEIRDSLSTFSRDTLERTDAYEAEADKRFRASRSIRLHQVWVAFHLLVAAVGIALVVVVSTAG
jgi:hypothetical protein